jgi:von Willebrand factor type A domain
VPYFAPDEPDRFDPTVDVNPDPLINLPVYFPVQTVDYPNNYLLDVTAFDMSTLRFAYWPTFGIPYPIPMVDPAKQQLIDNFWAHAGGHAGAQSKAVKYRSDTWTRSKTDPNYGPNAGCALQPVAPLTPTLADVKTRINSMTIGGSTNIPFGLVWGWHVISPNSPFTSKGVAYNTPLVTKVIVLMTDGENSLSVQGAANRNRSTYSGVGYVRQNRMGIDPGPDGILSDAEITSGSVTAALNARLARLCSNIKAQNVVIYTVGVEVSGGNQALLRSCATDNDKFFQVSNAAQMSARFEEIAESILSLHVSK